MRANVYLRGHIDKMNLRRKDCSTAQVGGRQMYESLLLKTAMLSWDRETHPHE